MDSFYAFCYATAGWLGVQALPLIFSPRLIVALLSTEVSPATPMEAYFARTLGFTLVPFAVLFLFLTGAFPLGDSALRPDSADVQNSPYTTPTLLLATFYHGAISFYTYSRYITPKTSQFGYLLTSIVTGALAAFGLWAMMFGNGSHISRRTGADKRTGGWPFKNTVDELKKVPKSVTRKQQRHQQEDIELKEL